jgi:hypothetical protein
MTTEFEGFCHSIMEAKMAALPVAGYELDYLDTAQPGTGYVSLPQGDAEALAARVCDLLADGAERRRLGALGRQDFERFLQIDQKALYREAFKLALEGTSDRPAETADPVFAANAMQVLLRHVDAHWRNYQAHRAAEEAQRRKSLGYRIFTRIAKIFTEPVK